jgi:hypothetical protein
MFAVMGGLVLLLVVAIYSALIVGKRTDQRIKGYINEESEPAPVTVRFPDDVFRSRPSLTRG